MSSCQAGVALYVHDLRESIVNRLGGLHPNDLRDQCTELGLDNIAHRRRQPLEQQAIRA